MLVARSPRKAERVVFPDELWQTLVSASRSALPLSTGVMDASSRGQGAKDLRAASDARRIGVPAVWSLGFNMKGWHGRGRVLRHPQGDYRALITVAAQQGVALFNLARQA
jgi:hypothetical protein